MPRLGRGTVGAVGDAFSGKVQLRWLTSVPGRIVVVDDGLATIRLLELLRRRDRTGRCCARGPGRERSVRRWGWPRPPGCASGGVTVFTALPVSRRAGARRRAGGRRAVRHDFDWLRAQPLAEPGPAERTVVLGTSLVRNGLVRRDRYLRWLMDLAEQEPLAYYPHRREDPVDLALIRERAGITVHEPGVPAELTLRGLAAASGWSACPPPRSPRCGCCSARGRRRGAGGRARRMVDQQGGSRAALASHEVDQEVTGVTG